MDLGRIEAVLLDMDGTLVDSDAAVERAWTTWAAEYGVDPGAVLAIAHGSPADVTIRALFPQLTEAEVERAAARDLELQYEDVSDLIPTPGALELVARLDSRGLPWAVVTSADLRLAKVRLDAVGIHPPVLVTDEDVVHGKPAPDPYLLGAARLNTAPARCLVVEDALPGVQSGRAAGCPVATVKGVPSDLPLPDLHALAALL
jgi:HAD superfamily hydrolase (TIGR01509 family)